MYEGRQQRQQPSDRRKKKQKSTASSQPFSFCWIPDQKKNSLTFFNDKAYPRGFISSHCHSFLNKSPLPRVCYPKEICLIFFGPDSLVIIIIGGPMKLRTFVGPKGPFTDGQRWKLVLVQSLLPHILGSQSYFHCVH